MTEFSELGLSPTTLQAVADTGYTTATPIQAQAIPVALAGRDVLGIAQTGTGKTAAFTLPMVDRLASGRAKARMPRALVLAPTRELADQVAESFAKYAKGTRLSWALLIGGVSMADQVSKLDRGVDVLIATPGRLLDLFERGKLMLNGVQLMVVDEADRMLDMGFIPDLERIFKLTPPGKQTLFFSATMPPEITRLTTAFLKSPTRIEVSRPATTAETITQYVARVPSSDPKAKRTALRYLIEKSEVANGIVFCNRKTEVDIVAKSLKVHGLDAAPIHGDLDQSLRMKTLSDFRSGALKLLVASDVAARGLDIPAVSHVFNYDVPHHADDYVHRIGRTGRAGRLGTTYMIVTAADSKGLDKVLKLIGKTPEDFPLDIDWSQVGESPPRDRGGKRGERSERGDRGGRGRSERGGRRGEAEAKPVEAVEPTVAEVAEEPRAEKPARRQRTRRAAAETPPVEAPAVAPAAPAAPQREARLTREERQSREDRPAREERPEREPRRDRNEGRGDSRRSRDDDDGRAVVGFGGDTPAFLMRAPPKIPSDA
ncbi:MAG: RNA helicase [Caulobacterales bacterium 68-7]|nr:MAG: RNA helicase [Caulobacterales bacterium 68-7]